MRGSCNLRRCNSWPLSRASERAFRNEASGYGFAANSQLPSFLRMHTSIVQNEDSTDSDMPAMLCGWCNGKNCNGIHLSYCRTWQNVSAQLNLDTPRLCRSYNSEWQVYLAGIIHELMKKTISDVQSIAICLLIIILLIHDCMVIRSIAVKFWLKALLCNTLLLMLFSICMHIY